MIKPIIVYNIQYKSLDEALKVFSVTRGKFNKARNNLKDKNMTDGCVLEYIIENNGVTHKNYVTAYGKKFNYVKDIFTYLNINCTKEEINRVRCIRFRYKSLQNNIDGHEDWTNTFEYVYFNRYNPEEKCKTINGTLVNNMTKLVTINVDINGNKLETPLKIGITKAINDYELSSKALVKLMEELNTNDKVYVIEYAIHNNLCRKVYKKGSSNREKNNIYIVINGEVCSTIQSICDILNISTSTFTSYYNNYANKNVVDAILYYRPDLVINILGELIIPEEKKQ